MAVTPVDIAAAPAAPRPRDSAWTVVWRFARKKPLGAAGGVLMLVMLVTALLANVLQTHDPIATDATSTLARPSEDHLLGTDHLGRDILVRIVYGARTSMLVGVTAVALAVVAGALAGLFAAEWGGAVDEVLMRVADIQLSIPFILLAITVLALLGGSMRSMVLVLVLAGWVIYARVLRSELLYLREVEFVQGARALGASRLRVVFRHLLPNTAGMIVVVATLELANVIILEAALSFLGVGIGPPEVSWGTMLADGRDYLTTEWWIATLPGVAIAVTILGVNLIGDWVRDVLDPRAARA